MPSCDSKTATVSKGNDVQPLNIALVKAKTKTPEGDAFREANRSLLSGTKLASKSEAKALLMITSLSEAKAHDKANLDS